MMMTIKPTICIIVVMLVLTACSQEPAEIHYGSDECVHCKMMITDSRFASQLVTEKGKAYKFDAIECMAVYNRVNSPKLERPALWVSNYENPGQWLNAKEATFVKSEEINSPMGESLLAFPTAEDAKEHIREKPGVLMDWIEVSQIEM